MRIIIERAKCIGCGSCQAVCPKFFELVENGKSHLKGSKFNSKEEKEELEVEDIGCAQEAANICPVECIHIEQK